jgi:tripartite-type tricarboxylate transporter receptor subunit TctC
MRKLILALMILVFAVADGMAQSWPTRPVRIIVAQAAGSAPDIVCRIIAERISRTLGQQIIVDNRPGAGNLIGVGALMQSPADGYTFLFATAAALVINPHTLKSIPYDPLVDLSPIGMVGTNPFVLMAHPSVPANSMRELVALPRSETSKLAIATDGPRTFSGILAAWLNQRSGMELNAITYSAMPAGIQDAIANRIQLVLLAPTLAGPLNARGTLKAIGVSSLSPVPGFENAEPIAKAIPGIELIGWFALVSRAGIPQEVAVHMNRELDQALRDPAVLKRLNELGLFTQGAGTPESAAAFIREQHGLWGSVVKSIGLEPQ